MGFHEVQFPTQISRGASSGPSTFTNIIAVDSGGEERVSRWNTPRWRGDARQGIKKLEDVQMVLAFYRARNGPANGFRYKDWLDYATTPTGSTWAPNDAAVAYDDVILGVGDGSETQFQLIKQYTSGPITVTRNIKKPVAGTVKSGLDSTEKTETADWTVDTTTGLITYNSAPAIGEVVKGGCQFDVPARFTEAVDLAGLQAAIRGFDNAEIGAVPLIELVDGLEVHDIFFFGGAADISGSADFTVTLETGRMISVNPTGAGVQMILPNVFDNLPAGGEYWFVKNRHGSNSFELREGTAAGPLISTLAAGDAKIVVLGHDSSGNKEWYAF